MSRHSLAALAGLLLTGLLACGGGGGGSIPAGGAGTTLTYVNPTGTSGQYALVLDPASTSSSLVLDLVGPAGTLAVGVTFSFTVDAARATWGNAPAYVANGTLFTSSSGLIAQGWVTGTGTGTRQLQGIVSYQGLANYVSDIGPAQGVICRLRLTPGSGTAGSANLQDSGLGTMMDNGGAPIPIRILVGSLTLE